MRSIIVLLILFTWITDLSAQMHTENTKIITGYVIDECGITLGGATIRVKNRSTQTIQADEKGSFSLEVEKGSTLEFLFVGMITQKIKIDYKDQYFIIMKEAELYDILISDCNPCEQRHGISVASQYMFNY